MQKILRLSAVLVSIPAFLLHLQADEPEAISPLLEPEAEAEVEAASSAADAEEAELGTKAFDAATVNEMFEELKAENEKRAEVMAPHMNSDSLDVVELGPINVQAYEIQNMDLLLEKLDPQPRRRLQRLAELDPTAAADLQVSIRSEERFFRGEGDYTFDDNAGRTANVDFRDVGNALSDAVKKAKESMREKKATDDQAELPTEAK